MNNTPTQLFTNQAANGASSAITSAGEYMTLVVAGTFGGGTVTIQCSPNGGTTWVDTEATFTAAGVKNIIGGEGLQFRLNLTGATSPSLNAWVAFQD